MVKDTGYLYLVSQAKSGDRESLEELAVMIQRRIQPYLCRYISDEDVCEDLLQEVLLAVVGRIGKLEQTDSFWRWVYSIAWSQVQQHFRDKKKMRDWRTGPGVGSFRLKDLPDERSVLRDVLAEEAAQLVGRAIGRLRKEYREVIRLRCFEGLPYLAVAARMQCSYGQSRLYFVRARDCLRERLAGTAAGEC